MIVGKFDYLDCKPLDFVQAANEVGIKPFVLRRHLEKPHVRAFMLAEKRAFNAMVCLVNPASLAKIRDSAPNSMARVAAISKLETQDDEASARPMIPQPPGVTICDPKCTGSACAAALDQRDAAAQTTCAAAARFGFPTRTQAGRFH